MALAPTTGNGTANLLQNVGQGSQKLSTQNTNLQSVGITTDAQAQALNQAYSTIDGVATNGPSIEYAAGAAVFQPLNGYTVATANQGTGLSTVAVAAQVPNGFTTAPADLSPSLFNSWSSGFQRQYIDQVIEGGQYALGKSATAGTDYKKAGGYLQIGGNTGTPMDIIVTPSQDSNGNPIYSGGKVLVVQNLTKTSFATMDFATQMLVANYDGTMGVSAFSPIATSLNLNTVNNVFTDPTTARTSAISSINSALAQIISDAQSNGVDIGYTTDTNAADTSLVNLPNLVNASTGAADGNASLISGTTFTGNGYAASGNRFNDGRLLNYNDVSTFVQELINLQKQLLNMAVFSPNDIATKISAITTRYKYISAFGSVPNQFSLADTSAVAKASGAGTTNNLGLTTTETPLRVNVVSTDNPTLSTANNQTYYLYKVQGWRGQNATNDSGYDANIQNQIQEYKYNDYPNNSDHTGRGNIDANDWVLVDGNGNLVELSGSPLTIVDSYTSNNNTQTFPVTFQSANGAVAPYKLDPNNNPAPFLFYQSSAGGTQPQLSNMQQGTIDGGVKVGVVTVTQSAPITPGTTNQTTIQSGYAKMIQAEQQTLALENQMTTIASTGVLAKKSLDVPSLIFFLQLYTNLIDEQQNSASTELVNQQNDLLNAYSQMQTLVNSVQGLFDPTKQTEQRDIFGNLTDSNSNNTAYSKYTANELLTGQSPNSTTSDPIKGAPGGQADMTIISMFDKVTGVHAVSPIEKIFNIKRPATQPFFDDGQGGTGKSICQTATQWNSFGTSLSSTVTQINQQTQIMMNNIDTLNKEKDQHFDLANNCLTKLNDILATIGRNVN